jgi:hypothetical protein
VKAQDPAHTLLFAQAHWPLADRVAEEALCCPCSAKVKARVPLAGPFCLHFPFVCLGNTGRTGLLLFFFFFGENRVCKHESALPLEPHLQSILLWLFWNGVSQTISLGWPQTISASQVSRDYRCEPLVPGQLNFFNMETNNVQVTKEDIQRTNKHRERCSMNKGL